MKLNIPELINSLTPIFIATVGAIVGVTVLISPAANDPAKWSSGMGLAGTAIAGAAGLAQSTKGQSIVAKENSTVESTES